MRHRTLPSTGMSVFDVTSSSSSGDHVNHVLVPVNSALTVSSSLKPANSSFTYGSASGSSTCTCPDQERTLVTRTESITRSEVASKTLFRGSYAFTTVSHSRNRAGNARRTGSRSTAQ